MDYIIQPIGKIKVNNKGYTIQLEKKYIQGIKHLEGFSHLHILWWAHLTDDKESRSKVTAKNLFRYAPSEVGVFASRTPERPNPIMISVIKVENIVAEQGLITTQFIDAEANSPVIDIKPYFPVERIMNCSVPEYYRHWPERAENAGFFNWKKEIDLDKI